MNSRKMAVLQMNRKNEALVLLHGATGFCNYAPGRSMAHENRIRFVFPLNL